MKARDVMMYLFFSSMLVGCQKCEDATEDILAPASYEMNCTINGEKYFGECRNLLFLPLPRYATGNMAEDCFIFDFQGEITNDETSYVIEGKVVLPELPEIGKKYPLNSLINMNAGKDKEIAYGCRMHVVEFPYFYERMDTLQLPEEERKLKAVIPMVGDGYIQFEKADYTIDKYGIDGVVKANFEIEASGENSCHPEVKSSCTITNGNLCFWVADETDDTNPLDMEKWPCRWRK